MKEQQVDQFSIEDLNVALNRFLYKNGDSEIPDCLAGEIQTNASGAKPRVYGPRAWQLSVPNLIRPGKGKKDPCKQLELVPESIEDLIIALNRFLD